MATPARARSSAIARVQLATAVARVQLAARCAFGLLLVTLAALPAAGQKDQVWTEIKSPNFLVVGDGGEKQARRVAEQFEEFRAAFKQLQPNVNVDLGKPLIILAARNEKSLRALLPEFWERKESSHPAGIFLTGQEKLYVALRTDVTGDFPYSIIYHEYVHALVNLNLSRVPVWLNEGFAEFYAHTVLGDKEAGMGRPSPYALMLLNREKLLPLNVLFAVDHDSPYYNEKNKTSIFYAQSWALVHYLLIDDNKTKQKRLPHYLESIESGVEPVEAARKAFGDLKQLEKTLNDYVRQSVYLYVKLKTGGDVDEKHFPMRVLSTAESAALRGNFHAHHRRKAEATALLEEALRLEPNNALAHESMGVLHLYSGQMEQAMEWFDKAARLDSSSYLSQYFSGMLAVQRGLTEENTSQAEARLLRAIELNSNFAPAYSTLASLYLARDEKLEEALKMARRAAQLEPGVLLHQINVANVLMLMDKVDEAMSLARSVAAAAKDSRERAMVESFLQSAEQHAAAKREFAAAKREADERAARRAAEFEALEKKTPAEEAERLLRTENVVDPSGQQGVARGTIAEVACTGALSMSLNLTLSASTLQFRAANRAQVAYYATSVRASTKPTPFNPCKELRGQRAQVVYRPVKGRPHAGEILAVELLADPAVSAALAASGAGGATQPASKGTSASTGITPAGSRVPGTLAEGRAAAVTCTQPSAMVVTIDFGGITILLQAEDRSRVQFTMRGGPVPVDFNPCTQLRGKAVAVVYKPQESGAYAGSILSVDIQP